MRILLLGLFLSTCLFANQRVVVAEEFTGTWCHFCPGAARGLEEHYKRDYDSLVVIAYHINDGFAIPEAEVRRSYYNVSAYPTVIFDGTLINMGGAYLGTNYQFYRHDLNQRFAVSSPLKINLTCSYDSIANTGIVNATIINDSSSAISGNLHFAIVENEIPYSWQGMPKLDFVLRDMLPDGIGEPVTIPASDSIIRSRNFSIGTSWNEHNCKIVVFVQASNKTIYQGAETGTIPEPKMEYFGMRISETNGNGNGWAEPGERILMKVSGKNLGNGVYTGGANVACSDPYLTIINSNPLSVAISPGDVDTIINFLFDINQGCPTPHMAHFILNFGATADTIPFLITLSPGFFDDIESGENGWTHSGTKDNWHITSYKGHSPTHSWYSGVESYHQYTNENDASLYSPFFVVTPDTNLYFYHQYSLETDKDFGYIEIDNGSGWWKTLAEFNGTQNAWQQETYSLCDYSGQTVRLRFRFISDYLEYWVGEGWYIDDILIPSYLGVQEKGYLYPEGITLEVLPNPFRDKLEIRCQMLKNETQGIRSSPQNLSLKIYNSLGRLVKSFDLIDCYFHYPYVVPWYGEDNSGSLLPAGVYFIKIQADGYEQTYAVVLLR